MESGNFSGTAEYYAVYRLPYPSAVIHHVQETFALDGTGRLLDIGCGPGLLTFALQPYFESSYGVDRDPLMIEVARREVLRRALVNNVDFQVGSAEQVAFPEKFYRLATFGTSFHWMDRERVAQKVRSSLVPGGGVAILTAFSLWHGSEPWKAIVNDVIFSFTGHDRRADNSLFSDTCSHAEILKQSGFSNVSVVTFKDEVTYSLETLLGFLYSTSFAAKARLGEKVTAFEKELASRLLALDSTGSFRETIAYEAVCASR